MEQGFCTWGVPWGLIRCKYRLCQFIRIIKIKIKPKNKKSLLTYFCRIYITKCLYFPLLVSME